MSESAEQQFDELTGWLAAELNNVRGDAAAEDPILLEAVRRYAEVRKLVDPEEPYSYVTQFFNADGVGWEKSRAPAFDAVTGATADERVRWSEVLGAEAMRLEAEMFE
jgi:hypothetical protein